MYALGEIAQALVKAGNKVRVDEVVQQAKDKVGEEYVLGKLAQALAEAGDIDRAEEVVQQALRVVEEIENKQDNGFALWRIIQARAVLIQALAVLGNRDEVVRVAKQVKVAAETSGWDNKFKVSVLSEVAKALAQVGEQMKAIEAANQVLAAATRIEKDERNTFRDAFPEAIQLLVQMGQPKQVRQVLRDAFTIVRLAGRERVFETLKYSASALAALDQGETLWRVYEAVMEVEGWWGTERMKAEG
jgi:tetratricopeptide (TPR) repeat protein